MAQFFSILTQVKLVSRMCLIHFVFLPYSLHSIMKSKYFITGLHKLGKLIKTITFQLIPGIPLGLAFEVQHPRPFLNKKEKDIRLASS